jgi:ketose-bisphosphate aldolase
MVVNSIEVLQHAKRVVAINVWDLNTVWALAQAAEKHKRPFIIQISEKVAKKYPLSFVRAVKSILNSVTVPIGLSLDHAQDVGFIHAAIEAGFPSVMFDVSFDDLETGIQKTRELVSFAHRHGVVVEGEIGAIKGVEDDIVHEMEKIVDFDAVERFLRETSCDLIAPAIGTAHGIYAGKPSIRYDLIQRCRQELNAPFVIHGGSGLPDEDMQRLKAIGFEKINFSTELKQLSYSFIESAIAEKKTEPLSRHLAWEKALEEFFISKVRWCCD